jgi:ABC-type antimicrobial peptide transport system permease subunit
VAQVAPDIIDENAPSRGPAREEIEALARTPVGMFWDRFRRDRVAITGAIVIVLLALIALTAPFLAHQLSGRGPN